MTFSFPQNRPTVSLWDIACRLTGQNATDEKPTNETRDKLAELAEAIYANNLWVRFHPDAGFDFVRGFMPAARHARIETDWHKLDRVTVDREDWARYEEKLATTDAVTPADIEQAESTLAQPQAPHVSKMVELIANGEPIEWDYWAGKMPRWTAYQAVRLMAALDPVKHHDLSFKRNETAGAAKEQATRLEMLAASHGMTEASPLDWLRWADGLNEPVHEGCRRAVTFATEQVHIDPFSEEDRRRLLDAEFWGERELLALCLGVREYFDRDDIAPEVEREAAKARIKEAIYRGDLPAEKNPQASAGTLFYGPGVWRINSAAAIPWAAARYEKFPDWLIAAYQAMNDAHTHADIPGDVIAQHMETPSHKLPPEVADHLGRRLRLIGSSLSEWDDWSPDDRRNSMVFADEVAAKRRADAEKDAKKRAEGRYTVREAAEILEARAGERVATMKRKLEQAVANGVLSAYEPGRYARYDIGLGLDAERVRSYYEEVYWSDLNAWLKQYEPRIAFEFPAPTTATMPTESVVWATQFNNGRAVEWDRVGEYSKMEAHQAILWMHGLEPEVHSSKPEVPIRLRSNHQATELFDTVRHVLAVAESAGMQPCTAAEWVAWANSKGFSVHSEFRRVAEAVAAQVRSLEGLPRKEGDQADSSRPRAITKHAIRTRSNPLKAVIDKAKLSAANPSDTHSVWAAFVKLAQDANRPAPLLGYVDAEGVKWDDNGTVKFLSKRNFADRMRRANTR